ncbi:MAG: DUF2807 domain-containing protein [Bacteroidales bacterium]|jgi:hypothetical protein|nr:DUF2807 domain-containing protein [Bacteroidales bacterium]
MKKLFLTTVLCVLFASFLTAQNRIPTANFTNIEVRNAFNVVLVPSDKHEVVIPQDLKLPDGLTPKDIVSVKNGTLTIGIPESYLRKNNHRVNKKQPSIMIYFKSLESLTLSGASSAESEQTLKGLSKLRLSGASNAKIDMSVDKLSSEISGASKLVLTGRVNQHKINASGASNASMKDLKTQQADVQISGASSANISTQNVSGNVSGASSLKGTWKESNVKTSGASSVKRR